MDIRKLTRGRLSIKGERNAPFGSTLRRPRLVETCFNRAAPPHIPVKPKLHYVGVARASECLIPRMG